MEYIASISYGKDSLAMLEVIHLHNLPLDRIVHVEIKATDTIHADLPPMVAFKKKQTKSYMKSTESELSISHRQSPMKTIFILSVTGKRVYMRGKYMVFQCKRGIGVRDG